MTDELTRKVMANLSGRRGGENGYQESQEGERNAFQARSLDPREEALLVERIHALPEGRDKGANDNTLLPPKEEKREGKWEKKTISLRDLAEQKH